MIEQTGRVVSVHGATAEVQAQREGSCRSCDVDKDCGTSVIARYLSRKPFVVEADNEIGAGPGDLVVIGMAEGVFLKASVIAYLTPLLAMIGGAVAGTFIAEGTATEHGEAISMLFGLGAFAVALVWLGRFSRSKSRDPRYRPRLLRLAGRESDSRMVDIPKPGTGVT